MIFVFVLRYKWYFHDTRLNSRSLARNGRSGLRRFHDDLLRRFSHWPSLDLGSMWLGEHGLTAALLLDCGQLPGLSKVSFFDSHHISLWIYLIYLSSSVFHFTLKPMRLTLYSSSSFGSRLLSHRRQVRGPGIPKGLAHPLRPQLCELRRGHGQQLGLEGVQRHDLRPPVVELRAHHGDQEL